MGGERFSTFAYLTPRENELARGYDILLYVELGQKTIMLQQESTLKRIYQTLYNITFGVVLGIVGAMVIIAVPLQIVQGKVQLLIPYVVTILFGVGSIMWYRKRTVQRDLFGHLVSLASGAVCAWWVVGTLVVVFHSAFSPELVDTFRTLFSETEHSLLFFFISIGWVPLVAGVLIQLQTSLGWRINSIIVVAFILLMGVLIITLTPSITHWLNTIEDVGLTETLITYILGHPALHYFTVFLFGGSLLTFAYRQLRIENRDALQNPQNIKQK